MQRLIRGALVAGTGMLMAAANAVGDAQPQGQPAAPASSPAGAPAPAALAAAPDAAQASYLLGLTFGEQLHSIGIADQIDDQAVARGVKEGLQGRQTTRADQQQAQAFVRAAIAATIDRNKAAAKAFLERNGREKGVKSTADGLEYKILVPGNPKAPPIAADDEVTVNYRGKLLDGTEFDSSYARGMPATFKVDGVIKGWQEALMLMKPGAKWQLFVPPELAYDTAPRPKIPAGSLLIFEVDLVGVKPAPAAAAAPAAATPRPAPAQRPAARPPASAPTTPPAPPAPATSLDR